MKKYVMPPPKTYTANSARILKDPKNSNNWRVKEPKKASPIKE